MYLVDSLARSKTIKAIPMLHEQSVGIAAEAYAQFRNRLGVALVTTGPGSTNALTPCAAAFTDSTPMFFISGQVKTSDAADLHGVRQYGFQEIPITEIVRPITKKAVRLTPEDDFISIFEELFFLAESGRPGPVWLDIPLDLQETPIDVDAAIKPKGSQSNSLLNDSNHLPSLLQRWQQAKRPLIMIGNGVRLAEGISEAKELIRRTATPAILTWKMIDLLDEEDPLNAGRPGSIAQRWANFAQQSSDFIISIGARLDTGQTSYNLAEFAPKAIVTAVDIDACELGKFPKRFDTFQMNAKGFLLALLKVIHERNMNFPSYSSWIEQIQRWKKRYPFKVYSSTNHNENEVNLYEFMDYLSKILESDAILVPGSSGACSEVVMQAFKVKLGQRIFNSEALGPMGFGIPAAIGACIASDYRKIYCIDGDGGFLMNLQELAVVHLRKLPIKFFVLNNNGYGSIRNTQKSLFENRFLGIDPESGVPLPDWQKVASTFGLKYFKLQNLSRDSVHLNSLIQSDDPTLIEVIVDKNHLTSPRTITVRKESGSIESRPMHEMTPPIVDREFQTLMDFVPH